MVGQTPPDPSDDFHVEVSDTRVSSDADTPAAVRSPFDPRGTPRLRLIQVAATVLAALLVLATIAGSIPAVRERALALIAGPTPTPTPMPGYDQFYLLPNPPGVDISLDGKPLALQFGTVPLFQMRLTPGHHTFAWRSRVIPFRPLQCRVSVPLASGDTCPFLRPDLRIGPLSQLSGSIIAMHASLAELPSDDAAQLTRAIQVALDSARSTTIVRPGEAYLSASQAQRTIIAQQPLRATLSFQYISQISYPEPCILGQPAIPCRFAGQDCTQLCTVAHPPASVAGSGAAWVVAAMVSGTWEYRTMDGQLVDVGFASSLGAQLAALRVTWDGAAWHAAPILGHTPGLDVADDLVCDPARYDIGATSSWSFMVDDPPPGAQVQFVSDATPADGCAAVLTHGQPAVFLERFGVLLTVNDAARNPVDNLNVADATDQQLTQRLLSQLQP
ncbi:MAG TPA: hypothetical protein VF818_00030 [Ktedonobacterales bacterium]